MVEMGRDPAFAQYLLARAYAQSGRVPEAQAAYKEALKIDPKLSQAKAELALLSGQKPDQGELLKEIEQLRAVVKANPKDVRQYEAKRVNMAPEQFDALIEGQSATNPDFDDVLTAGFMGPPGKEIESPSGLPW